MGDARGCRGEGKRDEVAEARPVKGNKLICIIIVTQQQQQQQEDRGVREEGLTCAR